MSKYRVILLGSRKVDNTALQFLTSPVLPPFLVDQIGFSPEWMTG